MMTAKEFREWLNDIPDEALIAVDEGGLAVCTVAYTAEGYYREGENYIEIGGIPLDEDIDEERAEAARGGDHA